jgi:mono/diheme cytochrome c family protein
MQKTRQGRTLVALVAPLLFFSAATTNAAAQTKEKDAEFAKKGRALYVQYCVSCHGPSGKGDGPAASALKVPPADLTSISQKYNGFPADKVQYFIDGEKYALGHGSREMPVWGKRLRRAGSEAGALGDVYALTKYLETIQKK